MSVDLYLFNEGYQTYNALNSTLHILSDPNWSGLEYVIASMVIVLGLIRASSDPKEGGMWGLAKNIALPVMLYSALITASVDVNIYDEFTGETFNVDDVPIGLAVPMQFTTALEKIMREASDNVLNPVNAAKFEDWDFLGHIKSVNEITKGEVMQNSDLYMTIGDYIDNCVLHAMSNGDKVAAQLAQTGDLESYLSLPYTAYFTKVYPEDNSEPYVDTCAAVYANITGRTTTDSTSTANGSPLDKVRREIDPRAVKSVASIQSSLDNLFGNLNSGYQTTSDEAFTQMAWIKGLESNVAQNNPEALGYYAEAQSGEKMNIIAAMNYADYLRRLRPVIRIFIIYLFPFVGLFFLYQNGMPFWFWFGSLAWVTLWMPVESVAHASINMQYFDNLQNMLSNISQGITYENHLNLSHYTTDLVGTVSLFAMMIPALAGMVLGWVMPKAAAGVRGMMYATGSIRSEASSDASGAGRSLDRRAQDLESDKIQHAFGEAANNYQFWRDDASGQNKAAQQAFGVAPGTAPFAAGASHIGKTGHLPDQSVQVRRGSEVGSQYQEVRGQAMQESKQIGNSMVASSMTTEGKQAVAQAYEASVKNGSIDEVAAHNSVVDWAHKMTQSHSKEHGITDSGRQSQMFSDYMQMAFSAGGKGDLGLEFMGTGIGFNAGLNYNTGFQYGEDATYSSSEELKDLAREANAIEESFKANVSEQDMAKIQQSLGFGEKDQLSNSAAFQNSVNDSISKVQSYTETMNKLDQMSESYSRATQSNSEAKIDINSIIASNDMSHSKWNSIMPTLEKNGFENTSQMIKQDAPLERVQVAFSKDFMNSGIDNQIGVMDGISKIPGLNDPIANKAELAAIGLEQQKMEGILEDMDSRFDADGINRDSFAGSTSKLQTEQDNRISKTEGAAQKQMDEGEAVQRKAQGQTSSVEGQVRGKTNGLSEVNGASVTPAESPLKQVENNVTQQGRPETDRLNTAHPHTNPTTDPNGVLSDQDTRAGVNQGFAKVPGTGQWFMAGIQQATDKLPNVDGNSVVMPGQEPTINQSGSAPSSASVPNDGLTGTAGNPKNMIFSEGGSVSGQPQGQAGTPAGPDTMTFTPGQGGDFTPPADYRSGSALGVQQGHSSPGNSFFQQREADSEQNDNTEELIFNKQESTMETNEQPFPDDSEKDMESIFLNENKDK